MELFKLFVDFGNFAFFIISRTLYVVLFAAGGFYLGSEEYVQGIAYLVGGIAVINLCILVKMGEV